jgi:hypothetical protein
LLRLPLEIRDRVWSHVFHDGRLLHIKHVEHLSDYQYLSDSDSDRDAGLGAKWRKTWRNAFCESLDTPYDTYEKSKEKYQTTPGPDGVLWATIQELDHWFPHRDCERHLELQYPHDHRWGSPTRWVCDSDRETVQFQILRVCHQTYFEANRVFWSNTILSFNDPGSFRQFMADRTSFQKKQLQKLRLELTFLQAEDVKEWNRVIPNTLVKSLSGLRDLHLHVRHEFSCKFVYMPSIPQAQNDSMRDMTYENILNFRILPLKNVTVIWQRNYGYAARPKDWSDTRNLEWADFFRERFLDPRGHELWQENKDREKLKRDRQNAITLACRR